MTQVFPLTSDTPRRPVSALYAAEDSRRSVSSASSRASVVSRARTIPIDIGKKGIRSDEKTASPEPAPTKDGASGDKESGDEEDSSAAGAVGGRPAAKKPRDENQGLPIEKLKWLTIAQAHLRYPGFSEKSLRHLQAQAEAYQRHPKAGLKSNGFINCLVRPAGQRKILINAEKFEAWLESCSLGQDRK